MCTRILFLRTLAILVLLASAGAGRAQTGTGVYPFGAYDSLGTDTINIGNLNAHLSFSIINKPGRGLPFIYNLNYDSLIWTPSSVNGTTLWTLAPAAGWRGQTEMSTGYLSYFQSNSFQKSGSQICLTMTTRNYAYHDPFGAVHGFPGVRTTIKTGSCSETSIVATGTAVDGSGYAINIESPGGIQVTAKDGHVFIPPQNTTTGSGTITDSNGNQISTDGSGNFTDSLGIIALAITGSQSSAQQFTYKDTNGNPQNVTVNYGTYTVQTAFGCSGITEFGPQATQLVSSIVFPDTSSYTFTYEATPGVSGHVTGRLASVTLPTGGKINYAYTGSNNGISCVDGGAMVLTRTLPSDPAGSVRTYTRTIGTSTSSTAVVDGLHNALSYSFVTTSAGPYETQRQAYNGPSTGTAVLNRVSCYNGASESTCVTTVPTLPIGQLDIYETVDALKQAGKTIAYDTYGNITAETDYDFGTAIARGSVLRKETITGYGAGHVDEYTNDTVTDAAGDLIANTTVAYDGAAPTATSGLPQHISVSGARGNLTSIEISCCSTTGHVSSTYAYDDTGRVLSSTDPKGNITSYTYDTTYDAYLKTLTLPAVNGIAQSEQVTPDFNTGLTMSEVLDGQTTSYTYDSMLRPLTIKAPDNGVTTHAYNPIGNPSTNTAATESISVIHAGTTTIEATVTSDWYGRIQLADLSDDNGDDLVSYAYDANSNLASATNPSKSGVAQLLTSATYDVLGRQLKLIEPDCQGISCSTQTSLPLSNTDIITDEAGNKRELFFDGLGRLSEVLEPDSNNNLTLETDYMYWQNYTAATSTASSTVQNIIKQKGGSTDSTQWRTRTFTVDSLGRLLTEQTPEAGITKYNYGTATSFCAGNITQPCSVMDARNAVVTYSYDALSRLYGTNYATPSPAATTPSVSYFYDQTSFNGLTITNGLGQMTGMMDGTGSTAWSYDTVGRPTATRKTLNGVTKQSNVTYNLDGTVNTLQDFGGTTFTYAYTGAGQHKGVTDQTGRSYASAATYNAAGELLGLTHSLTSGSLQRMLGYNNLLQPQTVQATIGNTPIQSLTIGHGAVGRNNGNISSIANGMDTTHGRDQTYQYDYLNRVKLAGDNAHWGEQYGYDNWGNLIQKTQTLGSGYSLSVSQQIPNNQLPQMSYDAAGDVTKDQLGTIITYDANGRIVAAGSGTYAYDGLGNRVSKTSSGLTTLYWPDAAAGVVDESNATGASFGRQVFVAGLQVWSEDVSGNGRYLLQDHLGSTRVTVNTAGSVLDDLDYRSFGDVVADYGANASDNHYVFTGYESDSVDSSTDFAQFRNLSSYVGRFTRPDPYDGSYDATNPQSLNRYAYVLNQPTAVTDPAGLDDDPAPCWGYDNYGHPCTPVDPVGSDPSGGSPGGDDPGGDDPGGDDPGGDWPGGGVPGGGGSGGGTGGGGGQQGGSGGSSSTGTAGTAIANSFTDFINQPWVAKPLTSDAMYNFVNFTSGYSDTFSLGFTAMVNHNLGHDTQINHKSGLYRTGSVTGGVAGAYVGAKVLTPVVAPTTRAVVNMARLIGTPTRAALTATTAFRYAFRPGAWINQGQYWRMGYGKFGSRFSFRIVVGDKKFDLFDGGPR